MNSKNANYSSPYSRERDSLALKSPKYLTTLSNYRKDDYEKEYNELSSQYRNMEYRFTLLQQEKTRNENEFRSRNELNLRSIALLRTEADSKETIISHLKVEAKEWKDALEGKIIENNRMKEMLEEKDEEMEKLYEEKRISEMAFNKTTQEKKLLVNEKETLNSTFKDKEWKIRELEKNLEKSNFDRKDLMDMGKKLEAELKDKKEVLLKTEKKIAEIESNRGEIQRDFNRNKAEADEIKQEMNYLQGLYKKEVKKNNELLDKFELLQESLRRKEKELQNQNEIYEDSLRELASEKKRNNLLEDAKRISDKEKEEAWNEKNFLMSQMKENNDIDREIIGILNTRKNSLKKLKY